MKASPLQPLASSRGATMITALLMVVALSLAVLMASKNTITNSRLMLNNRDYHTVLLNAETGITYALENMNEWLDENSELLPGKDSDAEVEVEFPDPDDEDEPKIAECRFARIQENPDAGSLSDKFVEMHHEGPKKRDETSGKMLKSYRYGILAEGKKRDVVFSEPITVEVGILGYFPAE